MLLEALEQARQDSLSIIEKHQKIIQTFDTLIEELKKGSEFRASILIEEARRSLDKNEDYVFRTIRRLKDKSRTSLTRAVQFKFKREELDGILDSLFEKRVITTEIYQLGKKPTTFFVPVKTLGE